MCITPGAMDLVACHHQRTVSLGLYRIGIQRLKKARPTRTGIELVFGIE
jgi:hypothetical protein